MDFWDLDDKQIGTIRNRIEEQQLYLRTLLSRMRDKQFPETDPLRSQVAKCAAELGRLSSLLDRNFGDLQSGERRPGVKPRDVQNH